MPPSASARNPDFEWPGNWPTRAATSETVNPGRTSIGKTLGPAAMTSSTVEKDEFWRKAYAPDCTLGV